MRFRLRTGVSIRPLGSLAACLALGLVVSLSSCASGPPVAAREWFDLGNAWLEKGDWKRAGQAYSRALALDPQYAGASYNLARAFIESGDYDRALAALDDLQKRDPGNVKIIASRAYALYKKGDAKAALAVYRELLKLDEFSPDAVYNAALLEMDSGDLENAIADLKRLTMANSDDGQAFLLLGRAIDRRASAKAEGSKPSAEGGKGQAPGPEGEPPTAAAPASSGASAASATAPAAAPGTPVAPPGTAAPKTAASASPGAPAASATAPAAAPGTATAPAGAAALSDDETEALKAYETAKALGKIDAEALERMGQLYEKERRYTQAMDSLEAAFKADSKRATAAFALARLRFVIADDSDKGLAALKNALDAGFSDKDAAAALLAEPGLPDRDKIYDLLKSKDLAE